MKSNLSVFWKKYWNFIFSTAISGGTLAYLWISKGALSGQSIRDASIAFIITLLVTFTFRLSAFQLTIENSQDLVSKFLQLLTKSASIRNTIEYSFEVHKSNNHFFKFFHTKIIEEYNGHLQSISHGKYICNAESELVITKSILECCNKCLKAISYQDEKWWLSNNGTLYLDAHEKYIDKKNEKAIRIFIIESTSLTSLKEVFEKHKELEIETYVLYTDKDSIDDKYKVDFVIYDDFMLRRASEVKNIEGGKDALFTSEEGEVKKYSDLFDQLLTIARKKNNILPI